MTGFGLKDSISDIISNQFDKIFTYDFVVTLSDEDALEDEAFQDTMGDTARVKNYMAASQQRVSVDLGDREFSVYLFVPGDTAQFAQFIDLHERRSGASIALTDGGVVVTEKFAEERGLSVGSELEIENSDGDAATFTVMGIAENYVENYVYITPDSYRDAFGKDAEMNSVLGILPDGTEEMEESLSEAILAVDGVAGLTPVSTTVSYTHLLAPAHPAVLRRAQHRDVDARLRDGQHDGQLRAAVVIDVLCDIARIRAAVQLCDAVGAVVVDREVFVRQRGVGVAHNELRARCV